MRMTFRARVFLGAVIAVMVASASAATAQTPTVVRVGAWEDPARVAQQYPGGAHFVLSAADYYPSGCIDVDKGDVWEGDPDVPRANITVDMQDAHCGFDLNHADGAIIRHVSIYNTGGDNSCDPFCGRGISGGGQYALIEDVESAYHPNQGMGGLGAHAVVDDSWVHHVGERQFTTLGGGVASAAGIKSVRPLTVTDTTIGPGVYWNGIWCDLECHNLKALRNTIFDAGHVGIEVEVADGPSEVAYNEVYSTGYHPEEPNPHSAIRVNQSSGTTVHHNLIHDNAKAGILVNRGERHDIRNTVIRDNTVVPNDTIVGCKIKGVTCKNNRTGG